MSPIISIIARKVSLLPETYPTVRSKRYEPLWPRRMPCHVRAVDPAVPDWDLAPVHTPHHTKTLLWLNHRQIPTISTFQVLTIGYTLLNSFAFQKAISSVSTMITLYTAKGQKGYSLCRSRMRIAYISSSPSLSITLSDRHVAAFENM
ncbi:hypothetical protein ARMGADRAFT_1085713 [Armillaria gallica]|uniref:Uncharacterized protein n=1 Tax=Armillaria gallica TaxID=47427 RepID=A0A2H3CW98_ARMGA|nr:hypothetical protein ARMGADRAFT_1085713 [Armillaria gallica]